MDQPTAKKTGDTVDRSAAEEKPVDFDAMAKRVRDGTEDRPAQTEAESIAQSRIRLAWLYLNTIEGELGARYSYKRCRLATYKVLYDEQREVVKRLEELRGRMDSFVGDGGNLILYGTVGTGKDHLLAAMLYSAASLAHPCRWISATETFGRMRDRMDAGRSEGDLFAELKQPEILAISDPIPPAGQLKEWRLEQLYRIIDLRYRALKSTWLTLNVSDKEEADRMLGQQAFDRLQEGAEFVACFWPSWREKQA